jgi:hypothetical protein
MSKTPIIDRRQSLDGIPVLNGGFTRDPKPGNQLDLVIRAPRKPGLLSRFMPPMVEQRFKLDELGTFVYGLIDGVRTVEQIMAEFAAHYRLNKREAEISVAAFLRMLAERKIISIVIK